MPGFQAPPPFHKEQKEQREQLCSQMQDVKPENLMLCDLSAVADTMSVVAWASSKLPSCSYHKSVLESFTCRASWRVEGVGLRFFVAS